MFPSRDREGAVAGSDQSYNWDEGEGQMRTRFVTFSAVACFVAASPVFSQVLASGMTFRTDATASTATITMNLESGFPLPVVTGAPYSGRQTMKSVQTLADGTRLAREMPSEMVIYRDSLGRVRTEQEAFPGAIGLKPRVSFTLVEIQDAVGGYRYLLDSVNRVAHRVPVQFRVVRVASAAPPSRTSSEPRTLPDGTIARSESLGTQVMFGVTVVGGRSTLTYPAGSRMGNDRPFSAVTESWRSPELGVTLMSRSIRPGTENIRTLEDFNAAEPDPTLFLIPSDYQVVNETGPFKIVIPREKDAR